MIICNLKNFTKEINNDAKMKKAAEFLLNEDLEKLTPGRISIDSDNIYVKIMNYETIPFEQVRFEAHNKYIDIHYVIIEKEIIWCVDRDKINPVGQYNIEKDVIHGAPKNPEDISKIVLSSGDLAVTYPSDAHAPKGMVVSSRLIKKIVIKVIV